jgi:RNA polymerase sigma-70 factor (ECF subfamily)
MVFILACSRWKSYREDNLKPATPSDLGCGQQAEARFDAFYQRTFGWVFSNLIRRGIPRDKASEFTQDIFFCVYTHGMHLQPEERAMPWLITVTRNKAISEFRRAENRFGRQELDSEAPPQLPTTIPSPEEFLSGREEVRALWAQIRDMPEMMRKCLILRYYHELSPDEAADYLGLSVNTVKTHLKRALAYLRLGLGEDGPETGE